LRTSVISTDIASHAIAILITTARGAVPFLRGRCHAGPRSRSRERGGLTRRVRFGGGRGQILEAWSADSRYRNLSARYLDAGSGRASCRLTIRVPTPRGPTQWSTSQWEVSATTHPVPRRSLQRSDTRSAHPCRARLLVAHRVCSNAAMGERTKPEPRPDDAIRRPACPRCGATRTQPFTHAGPAARVNMKCTNCGQLFRGPAKP
jgi:hypothetical protein